VKELAAFGLGTGLVLVGAVVTTGSRPRRALGSSMALSALALPWRVPTEHAFARGALALVLFVGVMREVDLLRGSWSFVARLTHVISPVDTRKLRRDVSRLDLRAVLFSLLWLATGGIAMALLTCAVPRTGGALHQATRWACGVLLVYALVDAGYTFMSAVYRALGFVPPPLHSSPILSRSIQEFWGRRWARLVKAWLDETFYRPLARRGHPALGVFVAFSVSAAFHAYAVLAAIGCSAAIEMFLFFVFQAVVVLLESRLGVLRWRQAPGRAWTVAWMLALSPLFVEPMLQTLGV
jgi:hypothetical protein